MPFPRSAAALLALFSLTPAAAPAAITPSVGVGLGTPGYNVTLGIPLRSHLEGRILIGGLHWGGLSVNTAQGGAYNGDLTVHTSAALLDFHPFGGAFFLSTGVFRANAAFNGVMPQNNGSYTLNGNAYAAAQAGTVRGTLQIRKTAPYLGLGYGPVRRHRGLGSGFDAGLAFTGTPQASVSANGSGANNPALQSDLAAERQQLQNSVRWLRAYPVLNLGLQATL